MSAGRFNRGHVYRATVDAGAAGKRLLDYLGEGFPHSTAAEWSVRIDAGEVRIDDAIGGADDEVRAGQVVAWSRPPWVEPEVSRRFEVLHEDDAVLVVAKPAGLPTLPGAGFLENTLLAAVRERTPGATPVHRLGRGTSGIVVFAKTAAARSRLAKRWNDPETVKCYRLLATGTPARDDFIVDTPIGPVRYAPTGTVHAAMEGGKTARTRVVVRRRDVAIAGADAAGNAAGDSAGDAPTFLADAYLETGRPHQIRIHLAAAGHPLAGDPLYATGGRPIADGTAVPGDPGYRLHAAEVRVPHPTTGEPLRIECPPPPGLRLEG